jgi:hypothetical protein
MGAKLKMSNEQLSHAECYAFDGMYFDYNSLRPEDEDNQGDRNEEEDNQEKRNSDLALMQLEFKLYKYFLKYSTHEKIIQSATRYLLKEQKKTVINKYFIKERLPHQYKTIVIQNDAIEILTTEFFVNTQNHELDYFELDKLRNLIIHITDNNDKTPAYFRVTQIRKLVIEFIQNQSIQSGNQINIDSDSMKNFLSACRIALLFHDYYHKNLPYQKKISENTQIEFNYQMSRPLEESYLKNGKRFISRWKARHLHTIEYYVSSECGQYLSKLKNINTNQNLNTFTEEVIDLCLKVEQSLKSSSKS